MPFKNTSAMNSGRKLSRPFVPRLVIAVLSWALFLTAQGLAQNVIPLTDAVQLQALETPTDDLIRLSTGYADALREYKVAKLSIDTLRGLPPNAVVSRLEVQIANLNLEAAERKVRILRAIVEKQLAAAENKLAITKFMERSADGANGANGTNYLRAQDEATVQILKMILAMK